MKEIKMFYLYKGDIIPNSRIGSIELGMTKETVEIIIDNGDCSIVKLEDYDVYEGGDIRIWIRKNDSTVTQILVFGGFKGKLWGEFGIGSYLADIEKRLNATSQNELYVHTFNEIKGICFELAETDIDDERDSDNLWVKANLPIEMISVYYSE